jgi:4-oxalocrotonate tautomerase family enzyme
MPFVTVALIEGITAEQKRAISEGITEVVSKGVDLPPDHIWVRFDEFSADNAGRGGVPYSSIKEIEIKVKKKSGGKKENLQPSHGSTTPWKSV